MNHYNARFNKPIPTPIITKDRPYGEIVTYTVDEETRQGWLEKYGPIIRPIRRRS